MTLRKWVKLIVPPILLLGYKLVRVNIFGNLYGAFGYYRTWNEAIQASTGYGRDVILNKTKEALLKVKNGQAVYERDSVIFDEIQYAWPLLAGLMWVAAQNQGHLNVLDFGGSLGSTYFQNRTFLDSLPEVCWNIVEQPGHVKVGKEFFEDERLKFFSSIKGAVSESLPNVVILSGVLQYLERPYDVLSELMELGCEHIIIDRTPFWDGNEDRLCVQHVPPSIYPASYPMWIFCRSNFYAFVVGQKLDIIAESSSLDQIEGPVDLYFQCLLVTRRNNKSLTSE